MSKTKSSGKTKIKAHRAGKRLGIKVYGDQLVKVGQIIVRQRGSNFYAGIGVKKGKDFTLFAQKEGRVKFGTKQGLKIISVA